MTDEMPKQIERIARAYDRTVEQVNEGVDPYEAVPPEFLESEAFKAFAASADPPCNCNAPDIREYLAPANGMRLLDVGCCANLANYRLDRWPSTYHGVDISPRLVKAMQGFAARHDVSIGGLWLAEAAELPFGDDFFDIAMVIGVLEYCTLEYMDRALAELHRVLTAGARAVVDVANPAHPHVETMFELERCFGRPNIPKARDDVERVLTRRFEIERADDSQVMLKYFVRPTHHRSE